MPILSFLGLFGFLAICWFFSENRKRINWQTVFVGLGLQILLGFVVLYWKPGNQALRDLSTGVDHFLNLSVAGGSFVFGVLSDSDAVGSVFGPGKGFIFAFMVLPTIIFFSAVMAVLYHLGVMQWVVKIIASTMVKFMKTSGSETLSVSANIFVGQTEAPFLIKPFLARMTRSELMAVMTGGFATIAGGVFALYVLFGVPAQHLIVASVMSAPAALVVSKMLVPETEPSETFGKVEAKMEKTSSNLVEAATTGTTDGLSLALNVGAMLIAFLGLIAAVNWLLSFLTPEIAHFQQIEGLTLQRILGWLFSPFAFLLGVEWNDIPEVGQLLGLKIAVNELVAYDVLTHQVRSQISERSFTIATYALCGFANLGSIGIQIGGISALCPERRKDLAQLAPKAMMAGAFASWMTASVAGFLT
ncbi:MAG TPA: NupC/NupG family nucleoside CNT transporter [Planctomycetes bacterium]|nr:NupC/NupG family nucleoside CNT transporter [Planctomycetota bacterium]